MPPASSMEYSTPNSRRAMSRWRHFRSIRRDDTYLGGLVVMTVDQDEATRMRAVPTPTKKPGSLSS